MKNETLSTHDKLLIALSALSPKHIFLENESHNHAGYYEGKESHFKLVVVSNEFDGLRLAARHQKVYAATNNLLMVNGGTIHALAIHTYTPDEWASQQTAPNSPNCAGQNKS